MTSRNLYIWPIVTFPFQTGLSSSVKENMHTEWPDDNDLDTVAQEAEWDFFR